MCNPRIMLSLLRYAKNEYAQKKKLQLSAVRFIDIDAIHRLIMLNGQCGHIISRCCWSTCFQRITSVIRARNGPELFVFVACGFLMRCMNRSYSFYWWTIRCIMISHDHQRSFWICIGFDSIVCVCIYERACAHGCLGWNGFAAPILRKRRILFFRTELLKNKKANKRVFFFSRKR